MTAVGLVLLVVGCLLVVYLAGADRNDAVGNRTAWDGTVAPAQESQRDALDPDLLGRFDQASQAAQEEGVELSITSGWRSASEQQEILDEKIEKVGGAEAHRLVAPVDASAHVQGLAIDVGPADAAAWLGDNGWQFGLCRVYANEPWHFEPTVEPGGACPALEPDASVLW